MTQETAGNGVVTNRAFNQNTGVIATIQAGTANAAANLAFAFDAIGNLTQRVDQTQSVIENFTYDVLNRLKTYNIVGERLEIGRL